MWPDIIQGGGDHNVCLLFIHSMMMLTTKRYVCMFLLLGSFHVVRKFSESRDRKGPQCEQWSCCITSSTHNNIPGGVSNKDEIMMIWQHCYFRRWMNDRNGLPRLRRRWLLRWRFLVKEMMMVMLERRCTFVIYNSARLNCSVWRR